MKKLLFYLLLLPITLLAQTPASTNNFDLKKILPTSPEAAMLGRFGDIPIGYYTGTADVSVPLYTISEGSIKIPLVLRYHSSGIKVEDEATNVGLGWSLEPGGSITKIINGKEDGISGDELPGRDAAGYAYLKAHSIQGVYNERPVHDFWPCTTSSSGDNVTTFSYLNQNEGQPDVFQYNFPGYSGKFYIHPETHSIVLIDKTQDISFTFSGGGWIAKTLDGTIFYFNAIERATPDYMQGENASLCYKLTQIVLHNNKEINFVYVDGFYRTTSYTETFHSEYPLNIGMGENYIQPALRHPMHYTKTLQRISTSGLVIDFNLEQREDLDVQNVEGIAGVKRIASVDIKDIGLSKKKSFNFNYGYFTSSLIGGSYLGSTNGVPIYSDAQNKRLKLLSVQEIGYTLNQPIVQKPYVFTYEESVQLPLKTSFARDFWGYYNGKNNIKLIPDLSFFYYSGDPDYGSSTEGTIEMIVTAHTGGPTTTENITHPTNVTSNIISTLQGANRAPDSTKMKTAVLKKITYPTGGFTEFTYQANSFNNYIYPDVERSTVAMQYKYISDYNRTSDTKSYTFSLANSQNVNFNNIITRGPNDALTFWDMQASVITLTKTVSGVNTVLKTWQMSYSEDYDDFVNNNGTVQWTESINLPFIAGAQYTVTASLPDGLGPQEVLPNYASVSSNFNYQDISQGSLTSSYGSGLRVSTIKNLISTGQIASIKNIQYLNEDNLTSGKLMSPIKPLYKRRMSAAHSLGVVSGGVVSAQVKKMDVWFISSESAVPVSSAASGNPLGYSRVVETEVGPGGIINGKRIYSYYNVQSDARPNVPDIPFGLNGKTNKEQIYVNTSSTPLKETSYNYSNKQTSTFNAFKIMPSNIGDDPCAINLESILTTIHKFDVISYPILSDWYILDSVNTKEYLSGAFLKTVEGYVYNPKGQLIKTRSVNSKQYNNVTDYLYPYDNPANSMSAALITKGLFDHVQQIKNTVNNKEISKVDINYKVEDNQIVQSNVMRSNGGLAGYEDVSFDKYGANKTLLQFTKNGPPNCILWSFSNTKPIAEIRNMTYATLSSVLGVNQIRDFAALANPSPTQINTFLAPIRTNPLLSASFVTTYTYDPLTGLKSSTDPKGMVTSYEYDGFQRLQSVKDQNGNIIKNYDYHYKP